MTWPRPSAPKWGGRGALIHLKRTVAVPRSDEYARNDAVSGGMVGALLKFVRRGTIVRLVAACVSAWFVAGCVAPSPAPLPDADEDGETPSNGSSEERTTPSAAAPASNQEPQGSAPTTPTAPPTEATTPQTPTPACDAGPTIYAFSNGDKWTYSTTDKAPSGFTARGKAFRLANPKSTKSKRDLYLLYSAQADDFIVSTMSNEGADLGYTLREKLGAIWSGSETLTAGLLRFVKPDPLRHYASVDAATRPSGFSPENATPLGFACPAN
jgi:hypothetical protein